MSYKKLSKCRLCNSNNLSAFIDFKKMPLAGAFLTKNEIQKEKIYPMAMQFCKNCSNVQVDTVIPIEILFKKYFYFSSNIKTLIDHFGQLANHIKKKYISKRASLLEIGCNDGVFLNHLANDPKITCIGVDPAINVIKNIKNKNIKKFNKPFDLNLAKKIKLKYGSVDIVVSSFSFGHINNMGSVASGINYLLKEDGVFIFEIYYLGTVIEEFQYDMMYHEHMTYYTIKSLIRFLGLHDLQIFNIEKIKLRSGSLRFYCKRIKNQRKLLTSVKKFYEIETKKGFNKLSYIKSYAKKIEKTKIDLLQTLDKLKQKNMKIYGYGASGRGTVIMNYCQLNEKYLDLVVDDAPQKRNKYTPGTHIKIVTWDDLEKNKNFPDYFVLFAWPFANEIISKRKKYLQNGGKFIVPLPKVKII